MLSRRKSGWELEGNAAHSVTEGTPLRVPRTYDVKGTTWSNSQIICTIGPKTNNLDSLKALINEGMSVARLNFSHGNHEVRTVLIIC